MYDLYVCIMQIMRIMHIHIYMYHAYTDMHTITALVYVWIHARTLRIFIHLLLINWFTHAHYACVYMAQMFDLRKWLYVYVYMYIIVDDRMSICICMLISNVICTWWLERSWSSLQSVENHYMYTKIHFMRVNIYCVHTLCVAHTISVKYVLQRACCSVCVAVCVAYIISSNFDTFLARTLMTMSSKSWKSIRELASLPPSLKTDASETSLVKFPQNQLLRYFI